MFLPPNVAYPDSEYPEDSEDEAIREKEKENQKAEQQEQQTVVSMTTSSTSRQTRKSHGNRGITFHHFKASPLFILSSSLSSVFLPSSNGSVWR